MTNAIADIPAPSEQGLNSGQRAANSGPLQASAQITKTAHRIAAKSRAAQWLGAKVQSQSIDTPRDEIALYGSLAHAVSALRWMTVCMLLLLTLVQPRIGKVGLLNWELVLLFLGYNGLAELALRRLPSQRALYWKIIVDLPAAATIYFCSATPGAPQFDLIFLAVLCAAIGMPLPRSLIYTAVAIGMTAIIEPTLPNWHPSNEYVRELGARMLLLALVGTGTAIVARRLTIEQQQSQSARREARRLEEIDRLRDDFISTITHDLRTPFTAVRAGLGMVEMSVADRLRPEELHLIANVRRNSDRLGILINDLLAFTQFETGAVRLDMQSLDLGDIVVNATSTLEPLIQEKGQTLHVNVDSVLPHRGDKHKLEQAIVNLVDNAHRHTPPGTCITVTGYCAGGEVHLVIQDNGPGIPPEECRAIFERFHRIDIKDGGWGLGLTIAQAITERHGGRIWVESNIGQGAAFHLALPRYDTSILDPGEIQ